ncbi:hypothetical protein M9H77_20286 [Catharanthus roseus]|uniref:Uncharacterized protein n=1 Tax=Catharanthus roseus TaxID=4058 RepID=A0ACC0ALX2_CATRO|nr:hypothetical protein M9H77_20286 [Catharanthus roseus]
MILHATNHLAKSNLIRKGHTGDLFRGVLDDGTQIVVKKVDLLRAARDYESELEAYGKVSHSRLVPLLGHSLGNSGEHFLIYKYMPGRDLASAFERGMVSILDWETRLKIATGVAEALYYLHHQCNPPLVHGDVQAGSILIDKNLEVRLGSLSKVCTHEGRRSNGMSSTTCAYDVYFFGKFLLQLIKGKPGTTATKGKKSIDKSVAEIYKQAASQDYIQPPIKGKPGTTATKGKKRIDKSVAEIYKQAASQDYIQPPIKGKLGTTATKGKKSIDKSVAEIYKQAASQHYIQPPIIDPSILINEEPRLINEEPRWFEPGWFKLYQSMGALVQWKMAVIAKNCLYDYGQPSMGHVLEALQKPWEKRSEP